MRDATICGNGNDDDGDGSGAVVPIGRREIRRDVTDGGG